MMSLFLGIFGLGLVVIIMGCFFAVISRANELE